MAIDCHGGTAAGEGLAFGQKLLNTWKLIRDDKLAVLFAWPGKWDSYELIAKLGVMWIVIFQDRNSNLCLCRLKLRSQTWMVMCFWFQDLSCTYQDTIIDFEQVREKKKSSFRNEWGYLLAYHWHPK